MYLWDYNQILNKPVLLRVAGMFDHESRPITFKKILYDAIGRPVVLVTEHGVHYPISVITSWEFVNC
jgi:hypothetical protein